jgi:hypothetical protein
MDLTVRSPEILTTALWVVSYASTIGVLLLKDCCCLDDTGPTFTVKSNQANIIIDNVFISLTALTSKIFFHGTEHLDVRFSKLVIVFSE